MQMLSEATSAVPPRITVQHARRNVPYLQYLLRVEDADRCNVTIFGTKLQNLTPEKREPVEFRKYGAHTSDADSCRNGEMGFN